MYENVLNDIVDAYQATDRWAETWKEQGRGVVGCLGSDVPEELVMAAGYLPVRLCGLPGETDAVDQRYLENGFDPLVRSQFSRIADGAYSYLDHLLVSNSSDALIRIYYYLRAMKKAEPNRSIPDVYFFDFLHSRSYASGMYDRERTRELLRTLEQWAGRPILEDDMRQAIEVCNYNRQLMRDLNTLRTNPQPQVSGTEMLYVIGASMRMPKEQHSQLTTEFLHEVKQRSALPGIRLFVTGSQLDYSRVYEVIESCGAVIVGDDHDFGIRHVSDDVSLQADPIDALVDRYHLREPGTSQATVSERVSALVRRVQECGAQGVIAYIHQSDDAPSWDFPEQRKALDKLGIPILLLDHQPYGGGDTAALEQKIQTFVALIENKGATFKLSRTQPLQAKEPVPSSTTEGQARSSGTRGASSVKRLRTPAVANAYQKEWFLNLRERVAQGEPFAFVNADVPQEIFRAMDIPYVVNQWWSSVCSAKQLSPYYLNLLNERGYPQDLCRYCSLSLASAFDPEPEKGPWGGLPRPTLAVSRLTCDAQAKIFELWSKEFGVPFYPLENTIPRTVPDKWWNKSAYQWDDLFEPHRLDYMVDDFKGLIRFLELNTGRTFSETRFKEVMALSNQQAEYNRKTRDLIATSHPAPVTITDTVPAVMIPQWQRGTQWAVDMARSLYEEVYGMVDRGEVACPNERVRLMWLGRGLWFNLAFYQHFEQKYGATFIWSIYLAIAADGYARYGEDTMRSLASRFAGMEDMLHMPPWNSDWYVNEARNNGIQGVVHLVPDSCTQGAGGTYFIKKAFEDAGIPILELRADPVDARGWDNTAMTRTLEQFLETELGVGP